MFSLVCDKSQLTLALNKGWFKSIWEIQHHVYYGKYIPLLPSANFYLKLILIVFHLLWMCEFSINFLIALWLEGKVTGMNDNQVWCLNSLTITRLINIISVPAQYSIVFSIYCNCKVLLNWSVHICTWNKSLVSNFLIWMSAQKNAYIHFEVIW